MNTASMSKRKSGELAQRYRTELGHFLGHGPKASLQPALRLGRQAVNLGLETLDLTLIHEAALIAYVLPIGTPASRDRIIRRAKSFFAQAIIPMEELHRAALEANARLSRLNRRLSRRTLDLAASNRKLKKEVARRRVVEETLRQSERHSGRLLEQSRHLQEELRLLSRQVLSVQEDERKRISRELHDVVAQVLTSINVRLALLKAAATVDTKELSKNIARTQAMVEKSVDIVHQFAYDLRPAVLDHLGLLPALQSFMKNFMKETGIRVSLTAFAGVDKLDGAGRTVLYRVAQEAFTNVGRHAHASRVDASIQRLPNAIRMAIKDNGQSFNVKRILHAGKGQRMGLLGMRERVEMIGGTFAVDSAPNRGTTIQVQIPFSPNSKEHTRQ